MSCVTTPCSANRVGEIGTIDLQVFAEQIDVAMDFEKELDERVVLHVDRALRAACRIARAYFRDVARSDGWGQKEVATGLRISSGSRTRFSGILRYARCVIADFHLIALQLGSEEQMLERALRALDDVEPAETAFLPEYLAWTPRGS